MIVPVFIGACPRSGTTMLGSLLGAGRECVCTPESQFLEAAHRAGRASGDSFDVEASLDAIQGHQRWAIWGLELDWEQAASELAGRGFSELVTYLVSAYADATDQGAARFWIDHTPENALRGGLLQKWFPDAHFIHLVRDGRAAAASVMPLDWGPNTAWHAGKWWVRLVACGLAAESRWPEDRCSRVRYEDLVRAPEKTLSSILREVEFDFDPDMMAADGSWLPDYTKDQHELVGQAPDPSRIDQWRETFTDQEVEWFESTAGPVLDALGYDVVAGRQAGSPSFPQRLRLSTEAILRRQVNKIRRAARYHRTTGAERP